MSEQHPVSPWYRQPWFWFLLIFPVAAILWCIVMITAAITSEHSLVTDDYSKEGRAINLELARDDKAVELGLHASLNFDEQEIRVTLDSSADIASYPYLVLNFFHPTLEERDRTVQLTPIAEHVYTGHFPDDMDGRWYLDIRSPDNNWRLKGEAFLPAATAIELGVADQGQG